MMFEVIRILIVEDNPIEIELLLQMLKNQETVRFNLTSVLNLKDALDLLQKEHFDLILLDLGLPDSWGMDTLIEVRSRYPQMPIIIFTSLDNDEFALQAVHQGAQDYLVKGQIDGNILIRSIRYALERHRLENSLRESRERFSLFMCNLPGAAFMRDLQGLYVYVNEQMGTFYSRKRSEWIGKTLEEIWPADFAVNLRDSDRTVINTKKAEQTIETVPGDEGVSHWLVNKFPILDKGKEPILVGGIAIDITKRLEAEEMLNVAEQEKALVLDNMLESVIYHNLNYQIVWANWAAAESLGLHPDQLVGQYCYVVMRHRSQPCRKCYLEKLRKDGQRQEAEVTSPNGKTWIIRGYPVQNGGSKIVGFVEVTRDISERKRVEAEKAALEAHLQQAQKMEALGTLAGGIAHDFNNILAAMLGYTELTIMEIPPGSPALANLEALLVAGQRAKDLIRQILTFSRQAEQERQPMEIVPLVQEALRLPLATFSSTIEIRQNLDPDCGMVLADPTQVHQIVVNLCTNACQAIGEKGGILEVSLYPTDVETDSVMGGDKIAAGKYIVLRVRDTGYGIDPEVMDRIFEPFFTTKELGKGTGLGLAVVHGIVASHGGAIAVDSSLGGGTTFEVFLPSYDGSVFFPEASVECKPSRGQGNILCVDDEENLVSINQRMLERLGYKIMVSTSSLEALKIFQAQPHQFDLVITDLTMPKLSGIELAREINLIRPDLPIILTTGYSEAIGSQDAYDIGIRGCLRKPFLAQDLTKLIRRLLEETVEGEK